MKLYPVFKKIAIKIFKITGWVLVSAIVLLIALSLLIRVPTIQNKLTQKAISFLKEKIKTEVRLEYISLSFPKKVVLTGIYLEDQSNDTLLYAHELKVDTDLWGLFHHRIQLDQVEFKSLTASVKRSAHDSSFNFDYIISAFAGDTTTVHDTTTQAWIFSVDEIGLEKSHLSFYDSPGGNYADAKIGELEINLEEFDLENSIYKADEIKLESIKLVVRQTKNVLAIDNNMDTLSIRQNSLPEIGFNKINLKDISIAYTQQATGQIAQLNLGEAEIKARVIDLKDRVIELSELSCTNTFISYHQMSNEIKQNEVKREIPVSVESIPWTFKLQELDLSELSLQYYDFRMPPVPAGIDFNHLWLSRLAVHSKNMEWEGSEAKAIIENVSLYEKSGFSITSFQTDFSLTKNVASVSGLDLKTPHSHISLQGKATFKSLSSINQNYQDAFLNLNVKNSKLSLSDLLYFNSHLLDSIPLKIKEPASIRIDTEMNGQIKDLRVDHLNILALDSTMLSAKGTIKGLTDFNHALMNIQLSKFQTTRNDLEGILPDSILPASIHIPERINLSGNFKGTMLTPDVQVLMESSAGSIDLIARMNLDSTIAQPNYTGKVNVKHLQIGSILGDSTVGALDMNASVIGTGLKREQLDARIDMTVNHFEYKNYDYKSFKLNGLLRKYFFSGTASLDDDNLAINIKGDLDYNEDVPHYKFLFELKNADLQALHLSERPLKARGTLDVDLVTHDFKVINGNLSIRKFGIYNGTTLYMVDSLLVASIDQDGQSEISIRSDIITGDFEGTINLYSLPQVIRRHFNNYFTLQDTTYNKPVAPQDFKFNLTLKDTDLLTEVLFPQLEPFVPGEISGEFNSLEHKLDLHFGISKIRYDGFSVDSIRLSVISDKEKLNYSFSLKNVMADTLRIAGLRWSGYAANDSLYTRLTVLDSVREEKYVIGGVFSSFKDSFRFKFLRDELLMNYEKWTSPEDNYLLIKNGELQPHHFELGKGNQKISLLKKTGSDSALSIVFQQLDLKDITSLVEGITPLAGIADGDLNISIADRGTFNSKLRISQFTLLSQTWGNLEFALSKKTASPYIIDLGIHGEKVELKVTGNYNSKPAGSVMQFDVNLSKLNLEAIQPLTFGRIKRVEGLLSGELTIKGNTNKPDLEGAFTFKNALFVPSAVNSAFKLNNETVKVNRSGFVLNKFKILDENNNIASVDGKITTNNFKVFGLELDLRADDFQLLNSNRDDNGLFYGKVNVTTRMRIRGTSTLPKVNMDVSLGDKSNFTFVVPQSEKGIQDQKGIVTFVDKDAATDPFLASISPNDTIKSSFLGMNLSANIELTDGETFNIIVDPATGDKLSVKGNGTLTFNMDPSGEMSLTGRYELTSGSYDFSFYKLVKRNFVIAKGSTITWFGDPMDAQMDIRAVYKVDTSPMELISNQIDITNQQEMNVYKQRIPFLVYLQIKGELLKPDISFKLDMPLEKQNVFGGNVYATIQDINTRESELNKQVFALLILKRFITENPLDSQSGDITNSARTSVSQILTEQLNRLSQNIKGLQLSFDLKSYEDYSSGAGQGQTQFQLGLSKTLFNDRLVVKVSGNLDLEGGNTSQQRSAADYIGDLALEYKVTDDGRFRVTGFRNSNYDMIDGELTETGAGLIYIKDYNSLRELFKANEKENP